MRPNMLRKAINNSTVDVLLSLPTIEQLANEMFTMGLDMARSNRQIKREVREKERLLKEHAIREQQLYGMVDQDYNDDGDSLETFEDGMYTHNLLRLFKEALLDLIGIDGITVLEDAAINDDRYSALKQNNLLKWQVPTK